MIWALQCVASDCKKQMVLMYCIDFIQYYSQYNVWVYLFSLCVRSSSSRVVVVAAAAARMCGRMVKRSGKQGQLRWVSTKVIHIFMEKVEIFHTECNIVVEYICALNTAMKLSWHFPLGNVLVHMCICTCVFIHSQNRNEGKKTREKCSKYTSISTVKSFRVVVVYGRHNNVKHWMKETERETRQFFYQFNWIVDENIYIRNYQHLFSGIVFKVRIIYTANWIDQSSVISGAFF